MKRKLTVCLLALLLCFGLSVNAFAAEIAVTQPGEVKQGDTVVLEIKFTEGIRTKSGSVELVYNSDVLSLTDGQWNLTNPTLQSFKKDNGIGVFAYSEEITLTDLLFTAKFQVKSDAAYGDASVRVNMNFKNSKDPSTDASFRGIRSEIHVSCMDHKQGGESCLGQLCSVCAYVMVPGTGHTYGETWKSDDTQHWKSCTACDAVDEDSKEKHVSTGSNVKGPGKQAVCDVCAVGYGEVPETEPTEKPTEAPEPTEETKKPQTNQGSSNKPSNNQSGSGKPAINQDGTIKPGTSQNGTTKPESNKNESGNTEATEGAEEKPEATQGKTEKPEETQGKTDVPEGTQGAQAPTENGDDEAGAEASDAGGTEDVPESSEKPAADGNQEAKPNDLVPAILGGVVLVVLTGGVVAFLQLRRGGKYAKKDDSE